MNMVNWIFKGGCVFMGQKADGVKSNWKCGHLLSGDLKKPFVWKQI